MSKGLKLIVEDADVDSFEYLIEQKNSDVPPKYYIKGPFILMNEKNENGRFYEEEEMVPSVDKYIKEFVETNRALNELNHPQCFTEDADILTVDGWKSIKDVKEGEGVYTLDSNGNIVEQPIKRVIVEDYSGDMLRIKSRNIDFTVTPEHRFPVVNKKGERSLVSVKEIKENFKNFRSSYIPKLGGWSKDTPETYTLKGVKVKKLGNFRNDVTKDIDIDYKTFVGFLGLWLAEGHLQIKEGRDQFGGSNVLITQRKEENLDQIRELLSNFPDELKWEERKDERGNITFYLSDIRLFCFLKPLGNCYEKYIPKEFKSLSPSLLEELLYWFNIGDGRHQETHSGYFVKNVFSTSKRLIDDLHEILLKSGGSGNVTTIICESDYYFADHLIKAENKAPLYQLHFSTTKGIYLDDRFVSIEIVKNPYDKVYCIQVENETFYARENGKSCWSGNSPDVNLERACDRTISLIREGNVFIGKAVCLSTPMGKLQESLIRDGVKLGKSTRCLGQIVESSGYNYVKMPRIRAVDTVHNPSGKGKTASCFVNGILENKEFIVEYDQGNEIIYDAFETSLSKLPRHDVEKYLMEQIMTFIDSIGSK